MGVATTVAAVTASTMLLGACAGSIDRAAFDAEIESRGGGLSGDRLVDGFIFLRDRLGDDLIVRSASIAAQSISVDVSLPDRPEEVDTYSGRSEPGRVVPGANLAPGELDRRVDTSSVDAALLEGAIDEAVATSDLRGPWANSLTITGGPGGTWTATLTVTNDRATEVWTFDADAEPERVSP